MSRRALGRGLAVGAAALTLGGLDAAPTVVPDPQAVLEAINAARTDPQAYAESLEAYRQDFRGLVAFDPATGAATTTKEGRDAVAEAEVVLAHRAPAPPLVWSPALARAAADLARRQGETGRVGHFGPDGESLPDRVRRYGVVTGIVAEGIAYGQPTAEGVARAFVVDDGVPDRSHRRDMLDPRLRYAGIACGPHPVYRQLCVVDYAGR